MKFSLPGLALVSLAGFLFSTAPRSGGQSPSIAPLQPPVPAPTVGPPPQPENPAIATFSLPGDVPLRARGPGGRFGLVGIRPHELVDIQIEYPLALANTPLTARTLDGGKLSSKQKDPIIAGDGTVSLRFQVGAQPGLYRVVVMAAGAHSMFQFWVSDPKNPKNNRPVLNPGH